VVRLCSTGSHPDLKALAAKLSDMLDLAPAKPLATTRAPAPMGPTTEAALAEMSASVRTHTEARYRGGLR
jgi:hypothetical protein